MEKLQYKPCFISLSKIYLDFDLKKHWLLSTKTKNIGAPPPIEK